MPIEEYTKEDTCATDGERVLVEMKSTQSDMTGIGFFTGKKEKGDADKLLRDVPGGEKNE